MAWLFPSLRHYHPAWLRGDLIAGLTVWAILVPESLAYASIAGVSPVVGVKTAVNGGAGAHSQVSGLVVAVLTLVTLLFLTGLFEQLPEATLAAVVIAAVIELVDFGALVALHRVWSVRLGEAYGAAARPDFLAAVAALLGALVFDTLPGLFIGIAVSLILLLYRASRPPGRHPARVIHLHPRRPEAAP